MKKKLISAVLALSAFAGIHAHAAASDITVKYNGNVLCFNQNPVIINDKTLVQLRPIAEAMGLDISFTGDSGSVTLSDENTTVVFTENSDKITVNDTEEIMEVPMIIRNDYTFVPVRNLVEPFGNVISYDTKTKTVTIETENDDKKAPKVISTGSGEYSSTYFYQSQSDLELENNGRGYCWVCAYAMLISDTLGQTVTPLDVAEINIKNGYNGNFMSGHATLVSEFGCKLVPALSEDSPYYGDFNTKNKGETTLSVNSDEEAYAAICQALDNFPQGIIVRYEGYPHSMTAVGYDDENIYFNDPGLKNGEHITFENTCLKNYKLSDISYIQALEVK